MHRSINNDKNINIHTRKRSQKVRYNQNKLDEKMKMKTTKLA